MTVLAYGTHAANRPLEAMEIERRAPGANDVQIEIAFCGVCHSDLHTARDEWGGTKWPCVPGHEIVGHVSAVGAQVSKFKVGDTVGVGCMVNSCRTCSECEQGLEQFCQNGMTGTYSAPIADAPGHTLGGYAQRIVVDESFVLRVSHPEDQLAAAAPLLCAGITLYSPLRHWQAGPGKKVGIVGIGGLGHMGIKLARAMGATTVGFTSSEAKRDDIISIGAHEVIVSKNRDEMKAHAESFDLIIDTVAASHNLDQFTTLLKRDGTLVMVGAPEHPHPSPAIFALLMRRRSIAGSMIGGIAETQEMLDFCAQHGIVSEIEMIPMAGINAAYERMMVSDVRYRFVIDNATLGG